MAGDYKKKCIKYQLVLTSGTVTPLVSWTTHFLHAVAIRDRSVSVAPAEKSQF